MDVSVGDESEGAGEGGVPAHGFGVALAAGAPLAVVVLVAVRLVDDLFGDDFLRGDALIGDGSEPKGDRAYFDDVYDKWG